MACFKLLGMVKLVRVGLLNVVKCAVLLFYAGQSLAAQKATAVGTLYVIFGCTDEKHGTVHTAVAKGAGHHKITRL